LLIRAFFGVGTSISGAWPVPTEVPTKYRDEMLQRETTPDKEKPAAPREAAGFGMM
jgi:hypothetical protein